jgi:hypothetical protein
MPPLHPGGGPTITPEPSPLPDQSDSLRQPTWVSYETRHGHRFESETTLSERERKQVENFIAASPSRAMSQTLAEMADGQVVSMDKRTHKFLVNIDKKSGSDKDLDRIRQIHGVPESAVKTTEDGWPMFLTPDGSRVVKREKSSDGRLTVEIQVENPDWDHLSKGRKQKTPALKIRYEEG